MLGTLNEDLLNDVIAFIDNEEKQQIPGGTAICPIDSLPEEVLLILMQSLNLKERAIFGATNKRFYNLAQDHIFWQSLNDYYFPYVRFSKSEIFSKEPKQVYIEQYKRYKASYGRELPMQDVLNNLRTQRLEEHADDLATWRFVFSAGNGQQEALIHLLSSDEELILRAYFVAKANGYIPSLFENFEERYNSTDDKGEDDFSRRYESAFFYVVKKLAVFDDSILLEKLLQVKPKAIDFREQIFKKQMQRAFEITAICSSVVCMKFIAKKYPELISMKNMKNTIFNAVRYGSNISIKCILEIAKESDAYNKSITNALIYTLKNKKYIRAALILSEVRERVSDNELVSLLKNAVLDNDLETVRFLVANVTNRLAIRNLAYAIDVQTIEPNILRLLVRCFSIENNKHLFILAAMQRNILNAQIIFDEIKVTDPSPLWPDSSCFYWGIDPIVASHIQNIFQQKETDFSSCCPLTYEQAEATTKPSEHQSLSHKRKFAEMIATDKKQDLLWMKKKEGRSPKRQRFDELHELNLQKVKRNI
ncbi:MAG: hypothetical protein J0H47_09045 [Gammaproteobacteria bacterium]|nr:hypothetical protein [Gammaproteobacteria bacterium]